MSGALPQTTKQWTKQQSVATDNLISCFNNYVNVLHPIENFKTCYHLVKDTKVKIHMELTRVVELND